ncbi:MAG: S8 family peptidase [Chromatiales bacterium]|jgi:serine protease|nr:S8 family peptidase [Chromatiales bacterium]
MPRWTLVPGLLLAVIALPGPVRAEPPFRLASPALAGEPTGRFIVKFRAAEAGADAGAGAAADDARRRALGAAAEGRGPQRARQLAGRLGMAVQASREITPDLVTVIGPDGMDAAGQAAWLERMAADPEVEFAVPDERRRAHAVPSDPFFPDQWYLRATEVAAARNELAWDTTAGAADTVVAVLDTGIRYEHPDLRRTSEGGRMLPGYDFVSGESGGTFRVANDGDGRDDDPSDPGDWLSAADLATTLFRDCSPDNNLDGLQDPQPSSWHGTRVAGMLAAITNNGIGLAGATWSGRVLPVRVLGKCGGYDSDIIAGMRWAAGLPVSGVPANPTPAKVLNMSLGGSGTCTRAYISTVNDIRAAGALVVASAGNENGPVDVPGNCPGALAVGGLRQVGTKVGYSSQGPEVGISAPAGNCVNLVGDCLFSLVTTTNTGSTTPAASGYTDARSDINIGTSFSAPIVAGIAALMHGVNAGLKADDLRARLQAAARPFPAEAGLPTCPATDPSTGQCNCTGSTCGAGIADAVQSVAAARRPIARIATPASTSPGPTVTLDGSASAAARSRTISAFNWTVASGPAGTVIANPTLPVASVVAPSGATAIIRLTVTDDQGLSDATTLTVGGTSGGGGGGGSGDWLVAGLLLGLLGRRRCPQR